VYNSIGAGGGGLLMFYAEDKARLRQCHARGRIAEVRFRFGFEGTKILNQ
jgi:D-glycero-alpha-D-manno-heptose-7-phosphate kinase